MALPRLQIMDGPESEPSTIITANFSASDALDINRNRQISVRAIAERRIDLLSELGADVASAITFKPPLAEPETSAIVNALARTIGGSKVQDLRGRHLETRYTGYESSIGQGIEPKRSARYLDGPSYKPQEGRPGPAKQIRAEPTKTVDKESLFMFSHEYYQQEVDAGNIVLFSAAELSWGGLSKLLKCIGVATEACRLDPPDQLDDYIHSNHQLRENGLVITERIDPMQERAIKHILKTPGAIPPSTAVYDMRHGYTIRERTRHNHGPFAQKPDEADTCQSTSDLFNLVHIMVSK